MPSPPSSKSSKRTPNGQWSRGVSGNPAGRPVGSRNKSTLFLEELLRSQQEALIEKAVDLALHKDDTRALTLCIERLLPALKERRIELQLPPVRNHQQATEALSTILTGIGEGQITPGEGAILAGIVEKQQRALETQRAEEMRQELEQQNGRMSAELQELLVGSIDGRSNPSDPPPNV